MQNCWLELSTQCTVMHHTKQVDNSKIYKNMLRLIVCLCFLSKCKGEWWRFYLFSSSSINALRLSTSAFNGRFWIRAAFNSFILSNSMSWRSFSFPENYRIVGVQMCKYGTNLLTNLSKSNTFRVVYKVLLNEPSIAWTCLTARSLSIDIFSSAERFICSTWMI